MYANVRRSQDTLFTIKHHPLFIVMAMAAIPVTPEAAAQAMAPATTRAAQAVYNDYHHNNLAFEAYLANTATATHSQFSSLKLSSDAQLCPRHVAHLQSPSKNAPCPLGNRCPFRHEAPGPMNFAGPQSQRDPGKRTICKHWLRGLCKKGDLCDYLHEYDMRRMPECRFFATFGYCNSGDDCLYLHVDRKAKIRECENYKRGFCPIGPSCPKKHVRRPACPLYIAGFCPRGPECRMGHIKATPPSANSRSNSPVQTHRPLTAEEAFGPRGERGAPMMGGGGGENGGYSRPQRQPYGADQGYAGNTGGPGRGGGGDGRPRRDLNTVVCYKCGEKGHFANMVSSSGTSLLKGLQLTFFRIPQCPNQNIPGSRGGVERGTGGRERPTGQREWSKPY